MLYLCSRIKPEKKLKGEETILLSDPNNAEKISRAMYGLEETENAYCSTDLVTFDVTSAMVNKNETVPPVRETSNFVLL